MNRITAVCLSAILLCGMTALSARGAGAAGQVIALEGHATATGMDGQERSLAIKSPIYMGDTLATAARSKLQILFDDDSIVSQGENSRMTIDEFVYDPTQKGSGRCALKLASGVFRAVTGKITEERPENFKVRTRMATIGIRGCEVAFNITQQSETIFVIELPDNRRVVVQTQNPMATGTMGAGEVPLVRAR